MTLEEAIKHCEEVADHCRWEGLTAQQRKRKQKCAEEHLQLANWLKELKEYREKYMDRKGYVYKVKLNLWFLEIDDSQKVMEKT